MRARKQIRLQISQFQRQRACHGHRPLVRRPTAELVEIEPARRQIKLQRRVFAEIRTGPPGQQLRAPCLFKRDENRIKSQSLGIEFELCARFDGPATRCRRLPPCRRLTQLAACNHFTCDLRR